MATATDDPNVHDRQGALGSDVPGAPPDHQGARPLLRLRRHGSLRRGEPGESSVAVTIEAASIDTNEPDRDKHLRSDDFFDVETHPDDHVQEHARSQGQRQREFDVRAR